MPSKRPVKRTAHANKRDAKPSLSFLPADAGDIHGRQAGKTLPPMPPRTSGQVTPNDKPPLPPQETDKTARSAPRHAGPRRGTDDQPGRARQRRPELAEGRRARADAARRLPPPREDHALRPRAHSRARRPRPRRRARTASSRSTRARPHLTMAAFSAGPGRHDAGLRALLDGGGLARLGRHGARRARLRGQVLHRRRATSTSSATTCRSSSSRTPSSSPTSSTR